MRRILIAARRHRLDVTVTLVWFLLANVVATAWMWRAPRMYEASVDTYVATSSQDLSTSYLRGFFSLTRVQSYTALATSDAVLRKALSTVDSSLSIDALATRVTATVIPQTVVLRIVVEDRTAQRARSFAKAIAETVAHRGNQLERGGSGGAAQVRLTVLQGVAVSASPVTPVASDSFTLAELAASALALATLAALRLSRARVSVDDVTADVGLPLLVAVRGVTAEALLRGPRPVSDTETLDTVAERFRILRTQLTFALAPARRSIVVTSPTLNERPCVVALGLGQSLAERNPSVALLDGDLRSRDLTRLLGLSDDQGLAEAVVGSAPLAVKDSSAVSPLNVVGAGHPVPSPTDLLDSKSLMQLIETLEQTYDYVVIAAPPLEGTADAMLWAHHTGATLIVARDGQTATEDLASAIERLRAAGGKPIGVVVT